MCKSKSRTFTEVVGRVMEVDPLRAVGPVDPCHVSVNMIGIKFDLG